MYATDLDVPLPSDRSAGVVRGVLTKIRVFVPYARFQRGKFSPFVAVQQLFRKRTIRIVHNACDDDVVDGQLDSFENRMRERIARPNVDVGHRRPVNGCPVSLVDGYLHCEIWLVQIDVVQRRSEHIEFGALAIG